MTKVPLGIPVAKMVFPIIQKTGTSGAIALIAVTTGALAWAAPQPARAWGAEGHAVVALIAREFLTPSVRARVDHLLATDADSLGGRDMASRAAWADAWREYEESTASWHYVNLELDGPSLDRACHRSAPRGPTSCVVDRIGFFADELADPTTPTMGQHYALRMILHLVGDIHQPLHASDNHDRGGNCETVMSVGADGRSRPTSLHSFWDTTVVERMGANAPQIAAALRAKIGPPQILAWSGGKPSEWAMETYQVAKASAYGPLMPISCASERPIALNAQYQAQAQLVAQRQLQMAGVRLASVLNRALSPKHADPPG